MCLSELWWQTLLAQQGLLAVVPYETVRVAHPLGSPTIIKMLYFVVTHTPTEGSRNYF